MPFNDPTGYKMEDLMGMERLGLQRDRLESQQDNYSAMQAIRQQEVRRKALETMLKFKGGGPIQEAMYTDLTGGHIPGATRHNELLDQDRFFAERGQQSMQRQQPQGLYRVGDEYGFNGRPMGSLSQMTPQGMSPDDYFDQIQAKHFANQEATAGAELDSNMGDLTSLYRQQAAQQQSELKRKQAREFMKDFEGRYGVNPGVAFQDFDPASKRGYDVNTGTAYIPGGAVRDPMSGDFVDRPGMQINIPRAEREAYGQYSAALAGFDNEEEMRMRDPRFAEMRQLQQEREATQRDEQNRSTRSKVSQASARALHQMRLLNDPMYHANFFNDLGYQGAQMDAALQRSPGAPVPAPDWLRGRGFMPPVSSSLGF